MSSGQMMETFGRLRLLRGVLKRERKKKSVPIHRFPQKTACNSYLQPWLVVVGGWRLVAIGDRQKAAGGWWRLVVVGGWRLAAVGGSWRLVAVGGPLGRSLSAVFKNKIKQNLVPNGPPCGCCCFADCCLLLLCNCLSVSVCLSACLSLCPSVCSSRRNGLSFQQENCLHCWFTADGET